VRPHPKHTEAFKIRFFGAGEVGMKTGAEFQASGYAAVHFDAAWVWCGEPAASASSVLSPRRSTRTDPGSLRVPGRRTPASKLETCVFMGGVNQRRMWPAGLAAR